MKLKLLDKTTLTSIWNKQADGYWVADKIAEKQAKLTAKQIYEWGNGRCKHAGMLPRHCCMECWQELEEK